MAKNDTLQHLPIAKIQESPVALRKVDKKKVQYMELVESIRQKGVLNPVVVREIKDPETGKMAYALVDGLHRYTAAQDAGLKDIPCHITNLKDAEVLEAQIIANLHKVETRPREYAENLTRLFTMNPLLTIQDIATSLSKSITWVSEILKLVKITDKNLCDLVNKGEIKASAAQALAELPPEEQTAWTEKAMTMPSNVFRETVKARVKEINDLKRKGKSTEGKGFLAVPYLRGVGEFKKELESFPAGQAMILQYGLSTPQQTWEMAVKWATNTDPASLQAREQKHKDEIRAKEERKLKEKAEREAKKSEEARAKAAQLEQLVS